MIEAKVELGRNKRINRSGKPKRNERSAFTSLVNAFPPAPSSLPLANCNAMNTVIQMRNSADNSGAIVCDETFVDCIAEGVCFDCASLTRVTFVRCDFYWASFFLSTLTNVTFDHCDLRGSDFKDSTLANCCFTNCDVGTDAIGGETQFGNTDLSSVEFINCRGR